MSNHDSDPMGLRRSRTIKRRDFLRGMLGGAAIAVSLPMMEFMLGTNGDAYADGTPIPKRFGVYYWGVGVRHETWIPDDTGPGFTLPHAFQDWNAAELEHLKPYLTMVTGMNHANSSPGHIPARGIALSSSHDMTVNTGDLTGRFRGQNHPEPSIDVIVSEAWAGQTPYDHLAASISQQQPYKNNSSWKRGGTTYNRHEPSPQALWDRFFQDFDVSEVDTSLLETTTKLEQSMLDAVMEDASRLETKMSAADRRRMEEHLDGLRDVERRLQDREQLRDQACVIPERPNRANFGDGTNQEEREEKNKVMAKLVSHALACDLTRVFSYEWSATQSRAVYWEVGATGEHHHEYSHLSTGNDTARGYMQEITRFVMKNYALLADELYKRQLPDGSNLLDHTLILGTSAHANAGRHNYQDHPYVFVGKAGGGIESGVHWRSPDPSGNLDGPKVLLTAARGVGLDIETIGQDDSDGTRLATEPISELLT